MGSRDKPHMPSDVSAHVGFFDRFAQGASKFFSKPAFFAFCLALVVVWAPSFLLLGDIDTWQLIINTTTTIVTFLMVALLQNTQTRNDAATQDKLNAIAEFLTKIAESSGDRKLDKAIEEVRDAVGLEQRESA